MPGGPLGARLAGAVGRLLPFAGQDVTMNVSAGSAGRMPGRAGGCPKAGAGWEQLQTVGAGMSVCDVVKRCAMAQADVKCPGVVTMFEQPRPAPLYLFGGKGGGRPEGDSRQTVWKSRRPSYGAAPGQIQARQRTDAHAWTPAAWQAGRHSPPLVHARGRMACCGSCGATLGHPCGCPVHEHYLGR